jgi:hypothetical protein
MAIVVTENWSGRKLSLRPPWTASRTFVVTGTTDEGEALAAVDATDSSVKIPQLNDVHPYSSRLLCTGPAVSERKGIDYWVIQADYAIPQAGQFPPISGDDPLAQEMTVSWEPVEISEPVDTDLDGLPILNSAGFPFKSNPSRPITYLRFKVERNEPYFDIGKFTTYANSVNESAVTISGVTFAAQHLRCSLIIPSAPYLAESASFVKMAYIFEAVPYLLLGEYPFQHRLADIGDDGWYLDGSTKRSKKFSNGKGETVSDVRLDGTGLPLVTPFPDVKVGDNNADPVTPPQGVDKYDLDVSSDAVTWLYYKRVKVVDFSPLFPD